MTAMATHIERESSASEVPVYLVACVHALLKQRVVAGIATCFCWGHCSVPLPRSLAMEVEEAELLLPVLRIGIANTFAA
jgi:hypothetical protein